MSRLQNLKHHHNDKRRKRNKVCLWHLDMDTFKITCFVKLSVPSRALGLPMDILSSVGVLRSEQAAVAFGAARQQNEGETSPRSGNANAVHERKTGDTMASHIQAPHVRCSPLLQRPEKTRRSDVLLTCCNFVESCSFLNPKNHVWSTTALYLRGTFHPVLKIT